MNKPRNTAANVDEYIAGFPAAIQKRLGQLRKTIRAAAPEAEEVISYQIPAYKYYGMLIFFAAFNKHISIYPAPRSAALFKNELAAYDGGKGTAQFPHEKPLPLDLVKRIVKFRMKENEEKESSRQRKRKSAAKKS